MLCLVWKDFTYQPVEQYRAIMALLFLLVLCTIFFRSHWLLSHLGIVQTMNSSERNIGRARDWTSDLLFWSPVCYQLSYGARQQHILCKGKRISRGVCPHFKLEKSNIDFFESFNPIPDMPILALPIQQQIKIWCQKYGQVGIQLSEWLENIAGKGEIARYEQFLLFPQCFQKLSVVDAWKWVSIE